MRKNLVLISSIILLILSLLGGLAVNTVKVSSVETSAIYIVPAETWNTSLTLGMNYPISIRTNYTGDDIYSYQFELEYNPDVLHGGINNTDTWPGYGGTLFVTTNNSILEDSEKVYVNGTLKTRDVDYVIIYEPGLIDFMVAPGVGAEVKATYLHDGVVNGDLITKAENDTAKFSAGDFDNTLGKLWQTMAYFYFPPYPPDTASGPGILANVTFHVVSYGFSDITLRKAKMVRYDATADEFEDIDTILQHGFFSNLPPSNDVAVTSLVVPATAAIEQPVPISVTVKNNGTYDEYVTLTVYYDSTVIDTTAFILEKGLNTTESFSWDTSGVAANTYTINATATIASDDEPGDNSANQSVTLSMVHDVAVTSLVVPATAAIEQPVPISVTVSNEGSYNEDVTLTVYNETTVIDTVLFSLAKGPTSNTSSFSWDTSGLSSGSYTINATATIASDDEPGDNSANQSVTLSMVHDVAVTSLVVQTLGTVGHPVPINVTVSNEGSYNEDVTLTVYNETTVIDTVLFSLAKGPTSNTSSFSWDTSGIAPATYTINATATITVDNDLSDNNKTRLITLQKFHNVAVVSITVPWRGNVNDNVPINVTVENTGSYSETFDVTIYYDSTTIDSTTVSLALAESKTINFTWNTAGVTPDFYTIQANASKVENETYVSDNIKTAPWTVLVTILGDVDGDGAVGTSDLIAFSDAYGSEPGDPNWNPHCDFSDEKIDASDLFDLSKNYGESYP